MKGSPDHCPHCQAHLTPEQILTHRPFSCPSCRGLVGPRPFWYTYWFSGCLLFFVAAGMGALALGWPRLISVVIGLVVGVAGSITLMSFLERRWPRPPNLYPHLIRTNGYPYVSDFIDRVLASDQWSPEFDRTLAGLNQGMSYDDSLEQESVLTLGAYRDTLQGVPLKKFRLHGAVPTLQELRDELAAIARDMRLGEKSCRPNQS